MITLSVIIPVYNEAKTLTRVVKALRQLNNDTLSVQCVFVDDNSSDESWLLINSSAQAGDIVLRQEKNQGKGAAVRRGLQAATGEMVIVQDADLEYDPAEIPLVIKPIIDGKADVVISSRFVGNQAHRVLYYGHYVVNKFLTTLSNVFTGLNLTDIESGYKAFNRSTALMLATSLKSNRFGVEPEIVARVAKADLRIYELGVSYYGRTYAEGKKINWKDGVAAVWHIIRFGLWG